MLATATISYDLADLVGADFDARRTKVWATTNVEADTLIDTVGNAIRLGDGTGTIDQGGAGSIALWVPGAGANPLTWQYWIHADYARRQKGVREVRTFGPFTITGDANLADLIAEQEVPPTYLSEVTAELDEYVDQAEAARNGAEAARDAAIDISHIDTSDAAVEALIEGTGGVGPLTRNALYNRFSVVEETPTTLDRWAEPADPDDTLGLQRMINAIKRAPNGKGRIYGTHTISDELVIDSSVHLEGDQERFTRITQVTPGKHGILIKRDTGGGEAFNRGVELRNFRLFGPVGSTKSGIHCADDADVNTYQGQHLNIEGVQIERFDIGIRMHRWDNSHVQAFYQACRLGLYASGNANSNHYEVGGSQMTEAVVRLGDGYGVTLTLRDLIKSPLMIDLLAQSDVRILGGNFEEAIGGSAAAGFIHIASGATLRGLPGRMVMGSGNDIPGVVVENGGMLAFQASVAYSGFTTSKLIKKANNNAIVVNAGPTANLGLAASTQVDDAGNTTYPANLWPVRQENAVPAASAFLRNLLLAVMARDSVNGRDRLLFGLKDKSRGTDNYAYADLTRIMSGTGSPEGVVYAPKGYIWSRDDPADAYTAGYIKTTNGDSKTGWQSFPNPPGATGPIGPTNSRQDAERTAAGLVSENFHWTSMNGSTPPPAGVIHGMLLGLTEGDVVTKLDTSIVTAGVGAAPTLFRMGLVNPAGNVVALTANEAANAALTATGYAQFTLTTPYTVPAGGTGGYKVILLEVGGFGTTALALGRAGAVANSLATPLAGGLRRFGTYGGGQTDLPAVGSPLPVPGGSNASLPFWVGCS